MKIRDFFPRVKDFLGSPPWRRYAALFLLGWILRLPILLLVIANPARAVPPGDAPGYLQLAINLLEHGVFSLGTGAPYFPDAFRTPGYPLFLDLVFQTAGISVVAVVVVQSLLHILTGLILARLGEQVFGSVRIGLAGALLWLIAPTPSIFSGILLTEILFTSVFLLLLWFLSAPSISRVAIGGVVFGFGILIRPIAILLWPALIPALCWGSRWRQALGKCALFSATLAVMVAPWIFRNIVAFGKPTLAAVQGYNLLYYNAAGYIAVRDGLTLAKAREIADREYREYLQEENLQPATMMDESDAMSAAAINILAADPVRSLLFNGWNSLNGFRPGASYVLMFLFPDTLTPGDVTEGELSPAVSNLDRPEILFTTVLMSIGYGVLFLLAAAGVLRLFWKKSWKILAIFGLPCGILMYAPGISSNARFRIPIEPVLCLLAAAVLCELLPRVSARLRNSPAKPQNT
jgi:hypothetical protein